MKPHPITASMLALSLAIGVPAASAQATRAVIGQPVAIPSSLNLRVLTGHTAQGHLRVLQVTPLRVSTIPSGTAASQLVPKVQVSLTISGTGLGTVTATAAPDAPRGTYRVERLDPASKQWVPMPLTTLQITVDAVYAIQSTDPKPPHLAPGRVYFTIVGTALDSLEGVRLVRDGVRWVLPGTLGARTTAQVQVTVTVPKYVQGGQYLIQVRKKGGDYTETDFIAEANDVKYSSVWTAFDPKQHGFSFPNSGWGDICYTTVLPFHLAYKPDSPVCGHGWGLCGGMSLAAGERFRAGRWDTHTVSQSDAKHEIVDDQFRTLDDRTVEKFFQWIYAPDVGHPSNPSHSITKMTQWDWNDQIKPVLDQHRPVVLGLVFSKDAELIQQLNPVNIREVFDQHQVLGIGYDRIGEGTVRITAYDPNFPDEILVLTFVAGVPGIKQELDSGNAIPADRPAVRGVMYIRDLP